MKHGRACREQRRQTNRHTDGRKTWEQTNRCDERDVTSDVSLAAFNRSFVQICAGKNTQNKTLASDSFKPCLNTDDIYDLDLSLMTCSTWICHWWNFFGLIFTYLLSYLFYSLLLLSSFLPFSVESFITFPLSCLCLVLISSHIKRLGGMKIAKNCGMDTLTNKKATDNQKKREMHTASCWKIIYAV